MCLIMVLMRFVRRNNMIGFVIWSLLGVFIIGLGIKDMFSKNPVGFWANTETIKVKDVIEEMKDIEIKHFGEKKSSVRIDITV